MFIPPVSPTNSSSSIPTPCCLTICSNSADCISFGRPPINSLFFVWLGFTLSMFPLRL